MNVLIIGMGYAGTRFLNAFRSIESIGHGQSIEIAHVGRRQRRTDIPFFSDVQHALLEWNPQIVVVSVTDGAHADVLAQLHGYSGFLICEKPLVNANDNLDSLATSLSSLSGFCMDMVERYSDVSQAIRSYVGAANLKLIRANFVWGKDRINDPRPTCGVPSEIIHALDLIGWIEGRGDELVLRGAIGTTSDFSVSGEEVLDSVAVTASLGTAVVTGYSSFVNIDRQRTLSFVFASPVGSLIYAHAVFDTPVWDIDYLKIWERTNGDDRVIQEFTTNFPDAPPERQTTQKLRRMVAEVVDLVATGKGSSASFADLPTSLTLQQLLNRIESSVSTTGPSTYVLEHPRPIFDDSANLERRG